jgi:hypothetical protein
MKATILASALALGLGLAGQANAFNVISFDTNGAAAGGTIAVDTFDWIPGNALSIGALGMAGDSAAPSVITTVYQAKLGSFLNNNNGSPITTSPASGTEFTIQATITELQTGIGTSTAFFTPLGGTVKMFYDAAANSNDISGTGFGDGLMILSGTILSGSGTYTDVTRQNNAPQAILAGASLCSAGLTTVGCVPVLLDQSGDDNQGGVLTHTGNGSSTLNVHVDYQDNNFFKSLLTSLLIGLNDTTNLADPFVQANPSDLIVGNAPSYSLVGGQLVNGGDCPKDANGNFTQRCDFHFQSDGATSFQAIPEPGTLALFSLGMMRKRA